MCVGCEHGGCNDPKYRVWLGQARIIREGWRPKFTVLLHAISEEVRLYEQALADPLNGSSDAAP